MTLETDWNQLASQHHLVLATKKLQTVAAVLEKWHFPHLSVRDPEKAVVPVQPEPRNSDPRDTARHKISRVKKAEGLDSHPELQKMFMATDVVFGIGARDSKFRVYHKIQRRPQESPAEYKERLAGVVTRRYTRQEFIARWDVAVALGKEHVSKTASDCIRVQASLSSLDAHTLENYVLGESNAGVQMAELARAAGADFEVYVDGNPEPFIVRNKHSKILEQWIVTKLPYEGMVLELAQTLAREEFQSPRYQVMNSALAQLLSTLQ